MPSPVRDVVGNFHIALPSSFLNKDSSDLHFLFYFFE